ncbi:recombinase family protein [Parablautia muri]|uniref:Recombinase n=1 Tax=Parablautia muri TaxID=2320879 RepID=A0A9X5GTK5_9FIRM|nr:recombinase family protein [Parablautia muri]NBJ94299.1 recombinase [Parablautia muri]
MDKLAIYLRLSLEDADDKDESNSISSQRAMLHAYICSDRELREKEVLEFCDDGYSGTSMERPGMQRLLKEVKDNQIGCVIVKDMSRFSRDYIELGTYMNQIFPFMGVRFIAVNDHYDSRDHAGSTTPIDTAFQTLLYDLYSKDISVKVKASVENKCAGGEYVFGQVPFGYEKSRELKNTVVVNEKEAEIVRCIFALATDGNGSTQIARILNEKGIPTKTQMRHPERAGKSGRMQAWDNVSVRAVLNNRFYLGEMAYGKSKRKFVGSKGSIAVPVEDWKVIPDHHEPLVSPEDYEKVCLFRKGADTARKGEKNPLVGKLFCGGCGYSMTYKPIRGKNKYRRFECRKHAVLQIRSCCTYFPADLLEETVLTMLSRELMVRGDGAKENRNLVSFQKSCITRLEKKITEGRGRKKQLQAEADALYESYALGTVQAASYRQKADGIKEQVALLAAEEETYGKELEQLREEYRRAEEDMKQVIRYSHLEVLTQEVVDIFIRKIYVYKDKRVEIVWNFRDDGKGTE